MGKGLAMLALGLLGLCAVWIWVALRRYAARRRLRDERAAAFMLEAANAIKKARPANDKAQNSA